MKKSLLSFVLCLPILGFAAEEYAGAQLPIVFAGPQTFIHDYKKDAHELIDGRFLGTDPFTGKVDVQYLYPIYDAGAPKLVTSILIQGGNDTDYYNTDRLNNFCVYGSNDKENWTLFWEGHGHTISRDWIFRVIRNPETGESKAYKLECKAVPTMSTAEELGTFDDSAYPIAERYRYYRIEPSPTAGFKTVNASEFSLWTSDLVVAGNRPTVYGNAEEFGTADDSEGVTFSGTLTYAPAGTADIYVAIHEGEFGADLEAWESNGAQIIKLAEGVASGAAFSVKVPGFNCGVYNSRIFAMSGDDVAASPCSYGFAVDMEARYPKTYYSAWNNDGDVHLMYDGNMDTYVDRDGAHQTVFVFDLSELKKEGMVPTAIRFWPRKGTFNVEKIRGRSAVISITSDDIAFPDSVTATSTTPRELYWDSTNAQAGANWTIVEDMSWTQIDYQPICYDVAIPRSLGLSAKYLKITNFSMGHAREFEIRAMSVKGLLLMIH